MNLSTTHDSALALPCAAGDVEEFLSTPWPEVSESLTRSSGDYMVLGAGGKMGLHMSRMLRRGLDEAGAPGRVLAVSRFGSPAIKKDFEEAGIEPVSCDLSEPAEVAS